MRSLITLFILSLATTFALGCGGGPKKALTPAEAIVAHKAPWDKLPKAERANYASCGDGTTAMTAFISVWSLSDTSSIGMDNPMEVAPNRFVELRDAPDNDGFVIVQFRKDAKNMRLNELAIVQNSAGEQIVLDYYIKRALDTGELKGNETGDALFAPATGEFFCFYP